MKREEIVALACGGISGTFILLGGLIYCLAIIPALILSGFYGAAKEVQRHGPAKSKEIGIACACITISVCMISILMRLLFFP